MSILSYEEIVPPELIREHLLSLPVEDIVRNRRVSKEFKNIIDKNDFWRELIERDYSNKYDKNECLNEYKKNYKWKKYWTISYEELEKYSIETNIFIKTNLQWIGFNEDKLNKLLYFDLKRGIYKLINFVRRKPKRYVIFHHIYSLRNEAHQYIRMLIKGKIKCINESIYSTKIIIYVKDFIELYEMMYGKDSFDKDFIKEYSKYCGYRKSNYDPQKLLTKLKNLT